MLTDPANDSGFWYRGQSAEHRMMVLAAVWVPVILTSDFRIF